MKDNVGRKLLNRTDVFIILFLIIISVVLIFCFGNKKGERLVAVISVDSAVTQKIDLTLSEDKIIHLNTEPMVTLEIKDHKIRFINSLCPDKTCEKSGYLEKVGDTAACVPAKTVVTIVGSNKSDVDIVVG